MDTKILDVYEQVEANPQPDWASVEYYPPRDMTKPCSNHECACKGEEDVV